MSSNRGRGPGRGKSGGSGKTVALWIAFALTMLTAFGMTSEGIIPALITAAVGVIFLPPFRENVLKPVLKGKKTLSLITTLIVIIGISAVGTFVDDNSGHIDTGNRTETGENGQVQKDADRGAESGNDKSAGEIPAKPPKSETDQSTEKPADSGNKPGENRADKNKPSENSSGQSGAQPYPVNLSVIPPFTGEPFYIVNDNEPSFSDSEKMETKPFEKYSDLDSYGRVGTAEAVLGRETMPAEGEKRGSIGNVKPSGWKNKKYDNVSGKYLYNRCHLIGYQLSAENDNEKNLMTGTRYFNVDGMLPFENLVADYIKETGNHVRYRVTPIYEGNNLLANGAQMEAYSIEDKGEGVNFNVYCYNSQPGIGIDYANGDSWKE